MPLGQLGPMPLVNVPSQEVTKAGRDLEPAPEIDPNLEVPIQEAQIEALFRAPEPGDFNTSLLPSVNMQKENIWWPEIYPSSQR